MARRLGQSSVSSQASPSSSRTPGGGGSRQPPRRTVQSTSRLTSIRRSDGTSNGISIATAATPPPSRTPQRGPARTAGRRGRTRTTSTRPRHRPGRAASRPARRPESCRWEVRRAQSQTGITTRPRSPGSRNRSPSSGNAGPVGQTVEELTDCRGRSLARLAAHRASRSRRRHPLGQPRASTQNHRRRDMQWRRMPDWVPAPAWCELDRTRDPDQIGASSVSESVAHGRRTMSAPSRVATMAKGNRSSSRQSATSSGWTP